MVSRYEHRPKDEQKRAVDRKSYWKKQGLVDPIERKNRAAKVTLPSIPFQNGRASRNVVPR